ncbi:MAG: hypothetical protein M3P53_06430 [Actinomycetota bacterium]|nr:hypothetical protein [Actinomycetota bacterium]
MADELVGVLVFVTYVLVVGVAVALTVLLVRGPPIDADRAPRSRPLRAPDPRRPRIRS